MENFVISVNAVLPFIIYMIFGWGLVRFNQVDEAFLRRLNQLVFVAFFPVTMFANVHNVSVDMSQSLKLVAVITVTLIVVISLSWLIVTKLVPENPKRGVIIQAVYRSNMVLFALPLATSIFGEAGAAVASLIVALFVPIYNVIAIVMLEYFRGNRVSTCMLIQKVLKNPLFQGALVGLVFAGLGLQLPTTIEQTLKTISGLTTPLSLMILGGTTQLASISRNAKYLVPTLTIKMLILPALALIIAVLVGLGPIETFVYFIMFATPIAVSSYSMAENMGGDGQLAGEFISISTVFSIFTLFCWIMTMRFLHLI